MRKKRIFVLLLAAVMIIASVLAIAVTASAAEEDWIAAPEKSLVKCPGGECDHTSCDYVYSFAVIGDTQNLNHADAANFVAAKAEDPALTYEAYTSAYMRTLYNWLLTNKESKNIEYVLGVGDITQSFNTSQTYYDEEWPLAKEAISLLDGKLGYSLVRGNHDISSGMNGAFGVGNRYYNDLAALASATDDLGRPMAGFLNAEKVEDTYRKIVTSTGDKYIIFTLDFYPTDACVDWVNAILSENSDYTAIITLHAFLNTDRTFLDDFETTTPAESAADSKWNQIATGGNVTPRALWENALSKHANVKLILSGHVTGYGYYNQLQGDNGNTVTAMLVDAQGLDSAATPIGMITMVYVSADGSVINVENLSPVREAAGSNAYYMEENQFSLSLTYKDGWTSTEYGNAPKVKYDASLFNVFLDDDAVADNDNFYFGGYNTWEDTLTAIHGWNGIGGASARAKKTYNIVMRDDCTYSNGIAPNASGNFPGAFNLDLNGKTLTLSSNAVLVPFYNSRTDASPTFTVRDGNVVMKDTAKLAVLQSSIKENGSLIKLGFDNLNVNYDGSKSPLVGIYNGFAGYKSAVDLTVTDCQIDTAGAGGAVTLFALNDTNNNCDVALKLAGGSIIGTSSENLTVYKLNAGDDTANLVPSAQGNYTTVALNENAAPIGIFRNEEGKLLDFVTESAEAPYVFTTEIAPVEETAYGDIPTDVYPAASYPFVLFQNGEIAEAYATWYDFCQNIYSVNTAVDKNAVLYLRESITVDKTSNQLRNVKNLTIDLGGKTLTSNAILFNLMAEKEYSFTTNINVKNGTVTMGTAWNCLVAYNSANTSDVDCRFNMTFDGVTVNASESFEGRLLVEAFKDGTYGMKNSLVFNNCTFDATVGSVSKLFQVNESNDQNKVDVAITFNGGKLLANSYFTLGTFSAEREEGKGSPDTLTINGDFELVMPSRTKNVDADGNKPAHPTTGIATTKGAFYPIEMEDDGTNSTYYFKDIVTDYGTISTSKLSAVDNPFIIFKNGSYSSAGSVWNSASSSTSGVIPDAISAASNASDVVTVLVRRDIAHSASKTVNTYNKLKGTLNVDFGGYTVTTDRELFQINQKNVSNTIRVNFYNGSIIVTSRRLGALSNQHGTAGTRQDLELTFTDMYIGYKSVNGSSHYEDLINQNGGSSTADFFCTADLTFDNCVLDLTGHTRSGTSFTVFTAASDSATAQHATHIFFKGGEIRIDGDHNYTLASRNTGYPGGEADTFEFVKDENGSYTKFVMISNDTVPSDIYDSSALSFALVSDDGTVATYQLGEDITDYHGYYIPYTYANETKYPFVVFKNGEIIHAFSNWKTFLEKTAENTEHQSGCTLVLRRDFTTDQGNSQNMCYITDMVIDLCGNRLIRGASHLFQAYGKLTAETSKTTSVTVKNGAVLVGASNAPIAFNNTTNGARHKFNFTFDNVVFGRIGNVSGKLIAESFTSGTYGSDNTITLNNCIVSLVNDEKYGTVAPSGAAAWFDLQDKKDGYESGFNNIAVVINGGEVRLSSASNFSLGTMDTAGDSITFAKDGGNYTAFTLPHGASAPTVSINGGDLVLVKISDNGETDTYRLRPKEVASIDFVPKMSLTLDRNLILNVYIPAADILKSFTLDGVEYTSFESLERATLDGEEYYVARIALDAKAAVRSVALTARVTVGEKTASATFTFGIIKYAEKILEDGSDVEKTLVKDVLQYIRAAYAYFGTTDAEQLAKIDTLLGEYASKPTVEGSAEDETTGLKSATLVLSGKPSIRFYLADGADASKYEFFIDGTRVKTVTADDGTYIDIDVYAYALCETVTYTVDGENGGSFHINAYYSYVSGDKYTAADKAELVALTESFWRYLQSARAYRDSVVEN